MLRVFVLEDQGSYDLCPGLMGTGVYVEMFSGPFLLLPFFAVAVVALTFESEVAH